MQIKMLLGALAIVALVTLAISLGAATPNVYGGGDDTLPTLPGKPELKYPNLGSSLDHMVSSVEEGGLSAKEAVEDAPVHQEASVAVTIYLSGNVDEVVKLLEDNGGSTRNVGEDYIEAYVPVSLLGQVSEQPGVIRVREITPPEPAQSAQQIAGHGPPVHGSTAWNQAGFGGQGVKVGVIDVGFAFNDFRGLMGAELPSSVQARCYTDVGRFTSNLADCGNAILDDNHGTLLAETVMDIVPEASLYIATPWSLGDLRTATDWMVSQGVSVIVHGVTYTFDGPGDGTSPFSDSPLKTVDRAVSGGIVWVNAAGNQGQRTWFGTYSIVTSGSSRFLAFDGTDVFNDLTLDSGGTATVQLRWEDSWHSASRDLDLIIWDNDASDIVGDSSDPQSGQAGQVPFEALTCPYPCDGRYSVVVSHESGAAPSWIQVTARGVDSIKYYTGTGSIANPAESSNPGMLAVGAAHWNNVRTIEPYSSRGPTPDGRVKPDIVGADCGATALISLNQNQNGFCGTSQSTAHVAGMAALVRQRFPTYTPVQVANYLKEHAEQRESPAPNNTWGHGFAKLPSLSGCSDAVPGAASNPGLVADCEALLAARDTLAGSGTLNWSGNNAIASWDGVTIDGSPLRVTKLVLRARQLTGTIPPELGGLASLVELNLGDNRLTGLIPSELSSLTNLEQLHLSGNQLSGEISTELGSLSKLEVLYLWGNQLTGPIPASLGGLANLKQLDLSLNQLSGAIPTELGSLSKLQVLDLSLNQLTGPIPASLGGLANLKQLDLSLNQLSGAIPTELGSLSKLQVLDLSLNQLTGPIPASLGGLANLEQLHLSGNQLSGEISTELGSLSKLQVLYLWENQLTGPIPASLGGLANLEQLHLSLNQLSGAIPTELGSLSKLQVLYLSLNQLTGPIPASLGGLANLEQLHLSGNQLSGEISTELGSLSKLQVLYLWENQLTGPIPASLGGLANLEKLELYGNQLSGEIPTELGSLSKLQVLHLGGNQLTGPIPASLGGLANLEKLHLSGNQLSGEISTELGSLSKLQVLYLWENQLTGPIPASLGGLANLEKLELSLNQLSGAIPTELGSLSKLQVLYLWENQLTGPIPASLGGLASLQGLSLSDNQLSGGIPSSLGSLANLQGLVLSDNQLTGMIPAELGGLANLQGLHLYGNQLSGEIPTELGSLANLRFLSLYNNQLSGEIPTELGSLANLHGLYLYNNQLSGEIPAELGSLAKLHGLFLSDNQLTGPIPSELGSLTNLRELSLNDNQLTGMIPTELGSLSKLQVLYLWGNQLTGPIPSELGSLTNLRELSLNDNQLTGMIPAELGSLTKLDWLYLSGNQLSGEVPSFLGSLANLRGLFLSDNQLSGEIPAELGSLTNLADLFLSGNQLTGCIPVGIAGVAYNDFHQLGLPFCAGASGAPTIGTLTPGADFLTITWAAPTGSPESAIIAYDLRYIESAARDKSDVNWTVVDNAWTAGSGALSYQIAGLTDGTQYDVQVRAVSAAGDGPWSAAAAGTPATWGAIRSFSPPSVAPAGEVVVMITASGYGSFGAVTETLPPGFSYVSSSLEDSGVTDVGREVRFSLFGQTAFTYTVTAPGTEGTYSFSGVLRNSDREDVPVGGALTIAVAAGDPLIVRYDANGNGMIEKNEVIAAINDYLFGEGDEAISKSDVIKLINLYLFG